MVHDDIFPIGSLEFWHLLGKEWLCDGPSIKALSTESLISFPDNTSYVLFQSVARGIKWSLWLQWERTPESLCLVASGLCNMGLFFLLMLLFIVINHSWEYLHAGFCNQHALPSPPPPPPPPPPARPPHPPPPPPTPARKSLNLDTSWWLPTQVLTKLSFLPQIHNSQTWTHHSTYQICPSSHSSNRVIRTLLIPPVGSRLKTIIFAFISLLFFFLNLYTSTIISWIYPLTFTFTIQYWPSISRLLE